MSQNVGRFNRGFEVKTGIISREAPVLIAGPTASGKSALAMELAARDGRLIINADALQVYANWRILTARPSVADEAALPHALYGHIKRDGVYSVGHWLREVALLLDRPVVIVGGTGLNFRALTQGLAEVPTVPLEVRAEADARRASEGHAGLLAELDPATAERIDRQNPVRIQRAWEVLRATGRGLASWQDDTPAPLMPLVDTEAIVLTPEVEWLGARIERRFHQMVSEGALNEAMENLADWNPRLPSAKAIGGQDLVAYLRGEVSLEEAIKSATIASRQYAKRQRTWFRSNMKSWRQVFLP